MDVWYNLYFAEKNETKAILNQWRVFLKQQKMFSLFPLFNNTDVEFCCCLFLLSFLNYWLNNLDEAVLDVHVWHRWSGHDWDFFFFLRRIEWICFYTNRWVCIIWETHKDRKHCEDQERGLNKFFLSFILIIVHFYIALFSALEQTHCAVVACDSERVTASSQNIPGLPSGSPAANR